MNQYQSIGIIALLVFFVMPLNIDAQDFLGSEKRTTELPGEIWTPQPKEIIPVRMGCDVPASVPSDAEILFGGKDLSKWESVNGGEAKWPVEDGFFTVDKKLGNIRTRKIFRDFQLHIEWRIPKDVQDGTHSQHRGNSGIFLQGKYEIQILDSYQHHTYIDGQAGSIYKQSPPLVNAMNPPGEWNI